MTIRGLDQWLTTPPDEYYDDERCVVCGTELDVVDILEDELTYEGYCSEECQNIFESRK